MSLKFYRDLLGFAVRYQRAEDRFAYLERDGAELMIEQTRDPDRLFLAGPLEAPFGRGMHLQITVEGVDRLYRSAQKAGARVLLAMEERWYRRGGDETGQRQFVITDPDGYVPRFCELVEARSA